MTTYLPQLTIPHQVFASAPASILLPVTLGTAVGYSTRRKFSSPHPSYYYLLRHHHGICQLP